MKQLSWLLQLILSNSQKNPSSRNALNVTWEWREHTFLAVNSSNENILFTASKGSWSKTVWRIISVKVSEHLLDTIFSPFRGQAGGDTPRRKKSARQFSSSSLKPLHFFWSVPLLLLAYNLDQKVLSMLELYYLNTGFGISPLTHFFHIFAWTCGAYVLPSIIIYRVVFLTGPP